MADEYVTFAASTVRHFSPAEDFRQTCIEAAKITSKLEDMCKEMFVVNMTPKEKQKLICEIRRLRSDNSCVAKILPLATSIQYFPTSAATEKSAEKSTAHRIEGNACFKEKKYHQAIELYNRSIALAPSKPDSTTLGMAYACRSAALCALELYNDCIRDIERALEYDYPLHLHYKVLVRKAKCYKKLGFSNEACIELCEIFNRSLLELNSAQQARVIQQTQEIKRLPSGLSSGPGCTATLSPPPPELSCGRSEELTSASSCVTLQYSESRGRHLVASRDIEPGDVLVVEEPYSSILRPSRQYSHCHHCMVRSHTLLPCPQCSWAMFCSELCMQAAQDKYHAMECPAMRHVFNLGLKDFEPAHLAIRSLAVTGLDASLQYHAGSTARTDFNDPRTQGFSADGKYISTDFSTLYHQFDQAQYTDNFILAKILIAVCLLKALHLEQNPRADEIGGLLLKLMRGHSINSHQILERYKGPNSDAMEDVSVAIGAYPVLGLINHSCDQHIVRHFHGQTCVVRALGVIRKGEEVMDTYGPHFLCDDQDLRKQHLKFLFFFDCSCAACVNGWPTQEKLPPDFPTGSKSSEVAKSYKMIADSLIGYARERKLKLEDLPHCLNYLMVMDKHGMRLCQEYFFVQEMVKVIYANLANSYVCLDYSIP